MNQAEAGQQQAHIADAAALLRAQNNANFYRERREPFRLHRLHGLALRLMKASNALYNKIDYRDGGSFSEPFTTKHWSAK